MTTKASLTALALAISLVVCTTANLQAAEQRMITIGTGGVTGVYYPTGGAICRMVNNTRKTHGIRCGVESTDGSVYNLNALRDGELDMAITQSDWQFHAYNGTGRFKHLGPNKELRSLFSVHPEPFTVVARADSGINHVDDMKGKRVNIGNPGSGQRATMEVLMAAKGWDAHFFSQVLEHKSAKQSAALCANEIDAMVFTVGHPSGSIKEATASCESRLVEVSGAEIDQLISGHSYYRAVIIPAGMYRGNDKAVLTFGVGATFVTSTNTSEEVAYQVVKAVFENFDAFKKLHPAFSNLKQEQMIKDGLTAPLHDGAAKYFREAGLM